MTKQSVTETKVNKTTQFICQALLRLKESYFNEAIFDNIAQHFLVAIDRHGRHGCTSLSQSQTFQLVDLEGMAARVFLKVKPSIVMETFTRVENLLWKFRPAASSIFFRQYRGSTTEDSLIRCITIMRWSLGPLIWCIRPI